MITKENEYTDPDLSPVGCWDPITGKKVWQLTDVRTERATWLRGCALVGADLLHPNSGKVIAKLPPNRTIIAARGQTIWTLTRGANQKFEVWRVR